MFDTPPAIVQAAPAAADPRVAAMLTLLVPAGGVAGAGLRLYPFHWALAPAAAMGLGAGHAYAGDPLRGLLVGAGAPVAIFGSGVLLGVQTTERVEAAKRGAGEQSR